MNILVTGCSRGVGLEICRVLLEQGHTVYGVARNYTDDFKELAMRYKDRLFLKVLIYRLLLKFTGRYLRSM